MDKKDFYFLGKIIKTSGYKGNLVFFFDVDDIAYYHDLTAVFAELGGELVPLAISMINIKNSNTAYVQLEDVNTEEEAAALTGSELFLPLSYLPPLTGNKFYYHEIMGFEVMDTNSGKIGIVESVIDQGPQDILIIAFQGKEILLPVSDEILVKVDRTKKLLFVNSPEGLLDIYI